MQDNIPQRKAMNWTAKAHWAPHTIKEERPSARHSTVQSQDTRNEEKSLETFRERDIGDLESAKHCFPSREGDGSYWDAHQTANLRGHTRPGTAGNTQVGHLGQGRDPRVHRHQDSRGPRGPQGPSTQHLTGHQMQATSEEMPALLGRRGRLTDKYVQNLRPHSTLLVNSGKRDNTIMHHLARLWTLRSSHSVTNTPLFNRHVA